MSRRPHNDDLSDARYITKTLDSARRDLSTQVHISQNASTNLEMEGEMIGDTLHIHKYDLKDSLRTTNSALNILDRLALRERYGLFIAQIFFYLTVAYIILKRIRILTLISFSWNKLYMLNTNITNNEIINTGNPLDIINNIPIDVSTVTTTTSDRVDDITEKLRLKDSKIFENEINTDMKKELEVEMETSVFGENLDASNSDSNSDSSNNDNGSEEEYGTNTQGEIEMNIDIGVADDSTAAIQEYDYVNIWQVENEEDENEEDESEMKEEEEEANQPSLPRSHPLFEAFDADPSTHQPDTDTEADHSEL